MGGRLMRAWGAAHTTPAAADRSSTCCSPRACKYLPRVGACKQLEQTARPLRYGRAEAGSQQAAGGPAVNHCRLHYEPTPARELHVHYHRGADMPWRTRFGVLERLGSGLAAGQREELRRHG